MPPAASSVAAGPPIAWSFDRAMVRLGLRSAAMVAVALILAGGVALRIANLEHLPGINGDEAWYGVWAVDFLAGRDVPWRTPTGNPVNLLFLGPQVALHALAPRSVALLRSAAVASGLLAVLLNFWLARRTLGTPGAWFSTLLLAALPVNVVYSRFAWDACQSVLAVVLVTHLSLLAVRAPRRAGRCWLATGAAMVAACWVHPTNVFALPMPVVASAWRYRQAWSDWLHCKRRLVLAAATCVAIVACSLALSPRLSSLAANAAARGVAADQYVLFGRNALRLFSGLSVYRYVAGSRVPTDAQATNTLSDWHVTDIAAAGVFLGLQVVCKRTCRGHGSAKENLRIVSWGLGLTLWGFFFVAGPESIEPHWERYGLCLVAPTTIWASLVLANCAGHSRRGLIGGWLALLMLCLTLELDCLSTYYRFLSTTGGHSHATFRCGEEEPKLAAIRAALADASAENPIELVTSQWWTYWPARYRSADCAGVTVADYRQLPTGEPAEADDLLTKRWVALADEPAAVEVRQKLLNAGLAVDEQTFADFSGRSAASLIRPLRARRGDAADAAEH